MCSLFFGHSTDACYLKEQVQPTKVSQQGVIGTLHALVASDGRAQEQLSDFWFEGQSKGKEIVQDEEASNPSEHSVHLDLQST